MYQDLFSRHSLPTELHFSRKDKSNFRKKLINYRAFHSFILVGKIQRINRILLPWQILTMEKIKNSKAGLE